MGQNLGLHMGNPTVSSRFVQFCISVSHWASLPLLFSHIPLAWIKHVSLVSGLRIIVGAEHLALVCVLPGRTPLGTLRIVMMHA